MSLLQLNEHAIMSLAQGVCVFSASRPLIACFSYVRRVCACVCVCARACPCVSVKTLICSVGKARLALSRLLSAVWEPRPESRLCSIVSLTPYVYFCGGFSAAQKCVGTAEDDELFARARHGDVNAPVVCNMSDLASLVTAHTRHQNVVRL